MSKIELVIDANNKPVNLPSPEVIIEQCPLLARVQSTATNISGVRLPLVKGSNDDAAYAWVKYGQTITMGEAKTQSFVAQVLDDNADAAVRAPSVYLAFQWLGIGYIVMEFIDGQICDNSDAGLVAAAVESLITIQGPSTEPGPVGGGLIEHRFFIDGTSSVRYESVEELEKHINGILKYMGRGERVSFGSEVEAHGLCLCPSDMNRANFMKDKGGRIVALNFGASCFLPPSFFAFALCEGGNFTQLIAKTVKHPASTQLNAMLTASYALVPFGTNNIGD